MTAQRRYALIPSPKTISTFFNPNIAPVQVEPKTIGKISTAMNLFLITFTLADANYNFVTWPYVHESLWGLCAASTIGSGFSYLFGKHAYKRVFHGGGRQVYSRRK